MVLNPFFQQGSTSEQNLVQSLINEQLQMYGVNVHYMPRKYANSNTIIKEVIESKFDDAYPIEAYVESFDGYGENPTLLSKFGIQATNELTLTISRDRFETYISPLMKNEADVRLSTRPKEGDLIYFPLGDRLFEIKYVEHEQPFYQLNNLPVFKLRCTLFEYSDEDLDTGIDEIDSIETDYAYTYVLTLGDEGVIKYIRKGEIVTQILDSANDITISGEVSQYTDSDDTDGGKLHLVHVGATDGLYHTFNSNRIITIAQSTGDARRLADSNFPITAINEENKLSSNEQNDDFETFAGDFLDFSESNPFGDPQ